MKTHIELAKLFQSIDDWQTIGTDTQFKIIDEEDETIIVFSPSNSKADWKINFAYPKKPYKRMKVPFYAHGGFLDEWKTINDYFLLFVHKRMTEENAYKPITIVGWSYGGAIATLCHEDFWYNFPYKRNHLRLVTFGSPRVIGSKYFKEVAERWEYAVLYANGSDIVTTLPPAWLGFKHVNEPFHIGKKKAFLGYLHPKKFHHIDAYVSSLEEIHD